MRNPSPCGELFLLEIEKNHAFLCTTYIFHSFFTFFPFTFINHSKITGLKGHKMNL